MQIINNSPPVRISFSLLMSFYRLAVIECQLIFHFCDEESWLDLSHSTRFTHSAASDPFAARYLNSIIIDLIPALSDPLLCTFNLMSPSHSRTPITEQSIAPARTHTTRRSFVDVEDLMSAESSLIRHSKICVTSRQREEQTAVQMATLLSVLNRIPRVDGLTYSTLNPIQHKS